MFGLIVRLSKTRNQSVRLFCQNLLQFW